MKITALKKLEDLRVQGNPRFEITVDDARGIQNAQIVAIQLHTFENGLTLFLLENYSLACNMILANRDGEISTPIGKPPFTLTPKAVG